MRRSQGMSGVVENYKAHILAVDDERLNLEIMSEYIEDVGCACELAVDGEEAWLKLVNSPQAFDVILLDRMMPNLDGIAFLQRVKEHPSLYSVPVIMQSACALKSDVIEGLRSGAFSYISKPFRAESLLSVINAAIYERIYFKKLQHSLQNSEDSGFVGDESFRCRNLSDAFQLSVAIAKLCPKPEKTVLGIYGLLVNGIEHGNLGINYNEKTALMVQDTWLEEIERRLALPENQDKAVDVSLVRDGSSLNIHIRDQGAGFDWVKYLDFTFETRVEYFGRGTVLSKSFCFDRLEYLGAGNEVRLVVEECFSH